MYFSENFCVLFVGWLVCWPDLVYPPRQMKNDVEWRLTHVNAIHRAETARVSDIIERKNHRTPSQFAVNPRSIIDVIGVRSVMKMCSKTPFVVVGECVQTSRLPAHAVTDE